MTSSGSRPLGTFISYCRLVPCADNSAGKTRHRRTRDGNRYRKQVFHTAAIRAAQYHPEIRQEYRRHARRKGTIVARADREGTGEHCVLGPSETGGVQWSVSRTRPNAEARGVAAAGDPEQSN